MAEDLWKIHYWWHNSQLMKDIPIKIWIKVFLDQNKHMHIFEAYTKYYRINECCKDKFFGYNKVKIWKYVLKNNSSCFFFFNKMW